MAIKKWYNTNDYELESYYKNYVKKINHINHMHTNKALWVQYGFKNGQDKINMRGYIEKNKIQRTHF